MLTWISGRSIITPNDGFLYQLQVFERCGYGVAEDHPSYISWKRAYDNAIMDSELTLVHIIPAVEDRVYFSRYTCHLLIEAPPETRADERCAFLIMIFSDLPSSGEDVKLILGEHAITHILSVAPKARPLDVEGFTLHRADVPTIDEQGQFLLSLPACVDFIHAALAAGGRVLVHSLSVSRSSIVLCAYRKPSPLPSPAVASSQFQ